MSYDDLKAPPRLPEPGFYRHYKYDPNFRHPEFPDAGLRNYSYLVLPNFGLFTEDTPYDKFEVNYLPLYPWAKVYQFSLIVGRICEDHRPLSMFLEDVNNDTYKGPRFIKEMNPEAVQQLQAFYEEMYGNFPQF